ncbi:hypothetical protein [Polycladomyces zharkentensis]|nr:hypothetical protein [Polycladomyces sp. WAk]
MKNIDMIVLTVWVLTVAVVFDGCTATHEHHHGTNQATPSPIM